MGICVGRVWKARGGGRRLARKMWNGVLGDEGEGEGWMKKVERKRLGEGEEKGVGREREDERMREREGGREGESE